MADLAEHLQHPSLQGRAGFSMLSGSGAHTYPHAHHPHSGPSSATAAQQSHPHAGLGLAAACQGFKVRSDAAALADAAASSTDLQQLLLRLQRAQAAEDDVSARLLIDTAEQRADGVGASELDTDVELALRGGVPAAMHRAAAGATVTTAVGRRRASDAGLDGLPLAVIMGAAADDDDEAAAAATGGSLHAKGGRVASSAQRAVAPADVELAAAASESAVQQRSAADGAPYARYPSPEALAALQPSRRDLLGWLNGPVATQGAHAPDAALDAASSYATAVHRARRIRESAVLEAGGDMRSLIHSAVDSISRAVVGIVAQDVEEALDSVADAIAEAV